MPSSPASVPSLIPCRYKGLLLGLSKHWMKFNLRAFALAVPSGSHTTHSLTSFRWKPYFIHLACSLSVCQKGQGTLPVLLIPLVLAQRTGPGTGQLLTKYCGIDEWRINESMDGLMNLIFTSPPVSVPSRRRGTGHSICPQ